ncbi:M23 family metallopeptidase [Sulfurimonas sp.]|uniref:M23 family metallopeptidase n=1 Tax=Sulfurimonas sp. TaxID=2022749 RepID=UPI0025F1BBED|nr:M23 family metallopeptidase [Sulfurimonas sp.]MDD5158221.1 M23 family metallopeptidase [Sulfurimonas sp.]
MRKDKNISSIGFIILLVVLISAVVYVYTSSMFEREAPKVAMTNNGYWNLREPLEISIDDVSGMKSYRVVLRTTNDDIELFHEQFLAPQKSIKIKVVAPKSAYSLGNKDVKIIVEAVDVSKWNFFNGNRATVEYALRVDKSRPELLNITNSYKINRGGSALVIFKAKDENLKNMYIEISSGKKFIPQPFYKDGYYISLIAWPITDEHFRATIVVEDHAKNISKVQVPLYVVDKAYDLSNIKLEDNFLKGKILELAEQFDETQGVTDSIEQFKLINETVRAKNEKLIHTITSKVSNKMISDFKVEPMYPLKNGAVVAKYGDHRKYYYNDVFVSEAYHMGLDLASNAFADIKTQNGGEIVFSDNNGLYGNMPIVDHGLGLYTLYGHCSSVKVKIGDSVKYDDVLAITGKSGYAMGDHLHFGVLVQGIEVRPAEWMDESWMKLNLYDVIKNAKEMIDSK